MLRQHTLKSNKITNHLLDWAKSQISIYKYSFKIISLNIKNNNAFKKNNLFLFNNYLIC